MVGSLVSAFRLVLPTGLAMAAFAGNSVLTRLALAEGTIDAGSFALVRAVAGAGMLWLLMLPRLRRTSLPAIPRRAPAMGAALALYLAGFSFAYLALDTGIGALILFGVVQVTMVAVALSGGERFSLTAWIGMSAAVLGLIYLLLPGAAAPALGSAMLMVLAGLGWAAYTLLGRGARDPLAATAWNFLIAVPLTAVPALFFIRAETITPEGILLAAASGALTSGLGYAVWYAVLPSLSAGRAAVVQLSVPPLAALAGVLLLGEALTLRLVLASALILAGIFLVIRARTNAP